jgi:DedD protein
MKEAAMTIEHGSSVKNFDDIQEVDPTARSSRAGALILASLGGALLVAATVFVLRTPGSEETAPNDPLGQLVDQSRAEGTEPAPDGVRNVTFPGLLSDGDRPTTALEAVRDTGEEDPRFALPPGHPTAPPPAADRLPVVPLPAQHVMAESESEAQDVLTSMARHVSRDDAAEAAAPGEAGGFQLQVSSFKKQSDADDFAAALRRRGHRAYVEGANVKGRGLWHRVRIGPFKHKRSAVLYRQDFEAKERIVTFIVSPPKTKVSIGGD